MKNPLKKTFAFVSDFDRTMTKDDFYKVIIDKHLDQAAEQFFVEQKKAGLIGVKFLNAIFAQMNMTQAELFDEIVNIELDPFINTFVDDVITRGGQFYIISAGTSFYIEKVLAKHELKDKTTLISIPGEFAPNMTDAPNMSDAKGGIRLIPDSSSPFYHPIYGIDKGKILDQLHEQYETVIFAGDSLPDLTAALAADFVYARADLPEILDEKGESYIRFNSFIDINLDDVLN